MSLKLYFHPLASFCHKALIALYENSIPFEPIIVDLADAASSAAFRKVWPMAKMPVLRDEARDRTVAESSTVIEYLDIFYPGTTRFLPSDPDRAWQTRLWDRFYDHYVQEPMQKIVTDRLRPAGRSDAHGVDQAKLLLLEAYKVAEPMMQSRTWAMGEDFTLADCAAAPALFYANTVMPFGRTEKNLSGYLDRLMARRSFARVLEEAQPYFALFPMENKPQLARPNIAAER
ncbi:MAG TPA: glutathione S-transferase family protein [Xanthobacteraceae bacterium]|nr:glutathione S-transferase family protein [Xanthobacteraceae bacterium]